MDDTSVHYAAVLACHISCSVPDVDASNPFAAKGIPSLDEFVVIHFRNLEGSIFLAHGVLGARSFSHINTLVVPGGKMGLAMG